MGGSGADNGPIRIWCLGLLIGGHLKKLGRDALRPEAGISDEGPITCGKPAVHVVVEEFLNMSDGQIVVDERLGPIVSGKAFVYIVVEVFGAECAVSTLIKLKRWL